MNHPRAATVCDEAGCLCGLPGSPDVLLFTEDVARLAGYSSPRAVTVLLSQSRKRREDGAPWPGDLPEPVTHADRKVQRRNRGKRGGSSEITVRNAPQWAWSDIKEWLARRAAGRRAS